MNQPLRILYFFPDFGIGDALFFLSGYLYLFCVETRHALSLQHEKENYYLYKVFQSSQFHENDLALQQIHPDKNAGNGLVCLPNICMQIPQSVTVAFLCQ